MITECLSYFHNFLLIKYNISNKIGWEVSFSLHSLLLFQQILKKQKKILKLSKNQTQRGRPHQYWVKEFSVSWSRHLSRNNIFIFLGGEKGAEIQGWMPEGASPLLVNYCICLSSPLLNVGCSHYLIQIQRKAPCVQICEAVSPGKTWPVNENGWWQLRTSGAE